jgi:hypothetical protein
MKLTLNIEKKHFYVLVVLMTLLVGIVVVNAYGTENPEEFGHSGQELMVKINNVDTKLQDAIDSGVFTDVTHQYVEDVKIIGSGSPVAPPCPQDYQMIGFWDVDQGEGAGGDYEDFAVARAAQGQEWAAYQAEHGFGAWMMSICAKYINS